MLPTSLLNFFLNHRNTLLQLPQYFFLFRTFIRPPEINIADDAFYCAIVKEAFVVGFKFCWVDLDTKVFVAFVGTDVLVDEGHELG